MRIRISNIYVRGTLMKRMYSSPPKCMFSNIMESIFYIVDRNGSGVIMLFLKGTKRWRIRIPDRQMKHI